MNVSFEGSNIAMLFPRLSANQTFPPESTTIPSGTESRVGIANSETFPVVTSIMPILFVAFSVNHIVLFGPAVISKGTAPEVSPPNSVMSPVFGLILPICWCRSR